MSILQKISKSISSGKNASTHHKAEVPPKNNDPRKVAIVGNPNVGKSAIFNSITGAYVTISNYPGTTVNISQGKTIIASKPVDVVDTPGMYSLLPITEEEQVARSTLMDEQPGVIMHVVDARNLDRMLTLTLQLIESGFSVILDLNMMDEAEKARIKINREKLEEELGIPVIPTVATTGKGIKDLQNRIGEYLPSTGHVIKYDHTLESALARIVTLLKGDYALSKRTIGLLLLQRDHQIEKQVRIKEGVRYKKISDIILWVSSKYNQPLTYVITLSRQREVKRIVSIAVSTESSTEMDFTEKLSRLMMNPLTGIPILLIVLYIGLYQFVGVLGAGILVDLIEGTVFGEWINPWITDIIIRIIPIPIVQDLFVGDFGIITLGLSYAFAIILPIVCTFFFVFSIIEDSGYLPRLAMLVDRVFKWIGLNGRAVIPIVLGFGCDTMATVVTRTLETRRERVITTLLLAMAIPCSAQLGVIFAILSDNPAALSIWAIVIFLVLLLVGYLATQIMPGEHASFYMEVPPLRLPKLTNVFIKTLSRLRWYLFEVLPFFIVASILLWLGSFTGVFDTIMQGLTPLVQFIGLPPETAVAFLYGFFRRDFGAAGLYDLHSAGILSGIPLVVTAVILTLFIPCIAQFMVMLKERGVKTTLAISVFVLIFAFLIGYLLNLALTTLGVSL